MIELTDSRMVQRHVDHIRSQTCVPSSAPDDILPDQDLSFGPLLSNDEPQPDQSQPPTEQQPDVSVRSSRVVMSEDLQIDINLTLELGGGMW